MCIGYILLARCENMLHQLELEFFIVYKRKLKIHEYNEYDDLACVQL